MIRKVRNICSNVTKKKSVPDSNHFPEGGCGPLFCLNVRSLLKDRKVDRLTIINRSWQPGTAR